MHVAPHITVLVADDHPVFREAVGRAINSRAEFELVGHAEDGRDALEELRRLKPTVGVLDQQLPSLSGLEILRAVRRDSVPTKVVILSGDDSGPLVYEAIQLGASAYMTKTATLEEICDVVAAVARGDTVLAPEVQAGLVDELRARNHVSAPLLSQRESEVLRLIAEGHSAPAIASRLFISPSTVKTHTKSLFEKLGVNDRAASVAEAMRRGLLE